jgi:UDP-glucose 4-epimerase
MRIFITGGTGFIGKYLVKILDNGRNKIFILARNLKDLPQSKNITYIKGNLSNIKKWKSELEKFQPQAAAHLAWEGIPDYSAEVSLKNLIYSINLIKYLVAINCQTILVTGTLWEYGSQTGVLKEDFPIKPFNSLTAAKNAISVLGSEFAREKNIKFIWTRLFYIYGPSKKLNSLISYLIDCAKKNKQPEIRNPLAKNDFIYVEDAAGAIAKLLLGSKQGGVFNIGSGKLVSVQSLVDKILKHFNQTGKYRKVNPKQIDSFGSAIADISKIEKEVGWKPKISIDEGIKKMINNYPDESFSK